MSDRPPPRGAYAGLLALALLAAAGLGGWYLLSDHGASTIDVGGFDVGAAPKPAPLAGIALATGKTAAPRSGLDLVKVNEEVRIASSRPAGKSAPAAVSARTLQEVRADFTAQVRRNEDVVRRYAEKMTAQSPVIRQYGRDWMSHPDLKKLNDDYMRDHDPIAFMAGLMRAPSAGLMIKQYASAPEIRSFVIVGVTKECPENLALAGLDLMHEDASLKGILSTIEIALGMPQATVTALTTPRPK